MTAAALRRTAVLLRGLLAAPALRAAYQVDLAPNGSFETDANRDGEPDDWRPAAYRSPAVLTWRSSEIHLIGLGSTP